jgi:D-alanine transaminase
LKRLPPPGRIAYVDGLYVRHGEAGVHVEDRGLQFGDSVYEVCRVEGGCLCDLDEHLGRLERSLGEVAIPMPMSRSVLTVVMNEVVRRNRVCNGLIYLQVTRGAMRRDFQIPGRPRRPTLILTAHELDQAAIARRHAEGVKVVTLSDERWARCDIKTTQLLAGSIAKTKVREQGAFEAWLVDRDGFVTEGASSNAWIVDASGRIVTRHLNHAILPGVTRRVVLEAAAALNMATVERKFTPGEAVAASEAFMTSSTGPVIPVVDIDGKSVGNGRPGRITGLIAEKYSELSRNRLK